MPSLRANGSRECAPDEGRREAPRHCERSEAIHLTAERKKMDCFVAYAPRNDGTGTHCEPTGRANARPMKGAAKHPVIASAAKQSISPQKESKWIASSLTLLAMTALARTLRIIASNAKQSILPRKERKWIVSAFARWASADAAVARAPRNGGIRRPAKPVKIHGKHQISEFPKNCLTPG
jgi:hypothetical protein